MGRPASLDQRVMMMWEFFKPWRRKIGVLTLVMACMFMALWLRGFSVNDSFDSTDWTETPHGVSLTNGTIYFGAMGQPIKVHNSIRIYFFGEDWSADPISIPHWSIVIPLTLISAWLLLRKIRNPKPQTDAAPSKA